MTNHRITIYDSVNSEEIEVIKPPTRKDQIKHGLQHTLGRWQFWLGLTLGFPLEHMLWEKAPVFSWITKHWLGL